MSASSRDDGAEKKDFLSALGAAARQTRAEEAAAHESAIAAGHGLSPLQAEALRTAVVARTLGRQSPRSRVVRRRFVAAALPLAFAAGVLIVMSLRGQDAPLPMYALEATGGVQAFRGDAPALTGSSSTPLKLDNNAEVSLVLRPMNDVAGAVGARAFLAHAGTVDALAVHFDVAPSGALALRGRAGALFGDHHGRVDLVIVIGRARSLGDADAIARASLDRGPTWQRATIALELP